MAMQWLLSSEHKEVHMDYYYRIYGLIVQTEIELPEAYKVEKEPADVKIRYGSMPDYIKEKQQEGYNTSILFREYKWFYFPGEGNFLTEKGTDITVEADDTCDNKHVRALILGACLGNIMYQREMLSIHGAAVVYNGKAIIVSGASGAGKSTVSTEFRKRGCRFLADDVIAVTSEEGIIYANPSFPQQKLCKDAAIKFGYDLKDLIVLQEDQEKYAVKLTDSFCPDRMEIAAFVYLNIYKGDQINIKKINNSLKFEYIMSNLYTYKDYINAGMNVNVFKKCLEMAQKTPVIRVERPTDKNAAAQIVDRIITALEEEE
jgi:hypothetical protein